MLVYVLKNVSNVSLSDFHLSSHYILFSYFSFWWYLDNKKRFSLKRTKKKSFILMRKLQPFHMGNAWWFELSLQWSLHVLDQNLRSKKGAGGSQMRRKREGGGEWIKIDISLNTFWTLLNSSRISISFFCRFSRLLLREKSLFNHKNLPTVYYTQLQLLWLTRDRTWKTFFLYHFLFQIFILFCSVLG